MNGKDVYDLVQISEEKFVGGKLVKGRFWIQVDQAVPDIKVDCNSPDGKEVADYVRKRVVDQLYGELEAIIQKYEAAIYRGLAASGDEKTFIEFRKELSYFFNEGTQYSEKKPEKEK